MISIPYAERNPNLPWGYWLTDTADRDRRKPLRDEEGRPWASIREYLWFARFEMAPLPNGDLLDEQLEFLLAFLVATDRRIVPTEEQVADLFFSWDSTWFYRSWLYREKLIRYAPGSQSRDELTAEARAILVMLASTRKAKNVPLAIGVPTLQMQHGLDPASNMSQARAEFEQAFARLEAFAEKLDYRFQRATIGKADAIKLIGDGLGPSMPIRRTLWSITFLDRYARDRAYLWLLHRIDRWPAWGETAYRQGPRALSEHLLQMKFADEKAEIPKV